MNQPNPELWARFVEAVNAGRVEGLEVDIDRSDWAIQSPSLSIYFSYGDNKIRAHESDHLCAELRRWMEAKEYCALLSPSSLEVSEYTEESHGAVEWFKSGTELDRHLQAALWVLESDE